MAKKTQDSGKKPEQTEAQAAEAKKVQVCGALVPHMEGILGNEHPHLGIQGKAFGDDQVGFDNWVAAVTSEFYDRVYGGA